MGNSLNRVRKSILLVVVIIAGLCLLVVDILSRGDKTVLPSLVLESLIRKIDGNYRVSVRFNVDGKPKKASMNIAMSEENIKILKMVFGRKGLEFWLAFGTFLGAYREGGIIRKDGDTDLALCSEDFPLLASCIEELLGLGFCFQQRSPALMKLWRGGEHTGLYLFHLENGERVWETIYREKNGEWVRKAICFDASAFAEFNEIEFLGEKWRILTEPERWLCYLYGQDWMIPGDTKPLERIKGK